MIKLRLYPSQRVHNYKTKGKAISEIRSNGLKRHQYTLEDTSNKTTYMSGLWLTQKEMNTLSNSRTITRGIKYIKYQRSKKR